MKVEIKKIENGEIEIKGSIPFSNIEKHSGRALKKLSANLNLPGFRKGHIPENIAKEKVGEMKLLNKMAEMALGIAYPKIIIDEKIDPIAHPQITILKLATGNPLEFKIKVPVMPEVKLADYKKISNEVIKAKEEIKVEKEDIEQVINQVLETKKDKSGMTPEITDELVKTLGDFKNVKDFNEKIADGVKKEKEFRQKEKIRIQIIEKIILESKIDLPEVIIKSEIEKMLAQFKGDIEKMGLKVDEYLKNTGKTEDELRVEWRGEAEKKGKSQMILNKIAIEEKVYPKASEVEKEAKHLMEHHKKANPDRVRVFVESMLTNEKVFQFLENPKIEKGSKKE